MKFEDVYKKYQPVIAGWIKSKITDSCDVEELTNDVFLKVYSSLDTFDESKSSLNTWIHNITKNTLIDYFRKKRPQILSIDIDTTEETEDLSSIQIESPDLNPLAALIDKETTDKIKTAINSLPDNYAHVANLFYISNFKQKEIADQLGIPVNTVKTKLRKTRELLRAFRLTV